jgi:transposase
MAMTIVETTRPITGGVDTHLDVHVAAALDANGGVLGVQSFATTSIGFVELHGWLTTFGLVARVGVEGTGAYGAGLARYLRGQGLEVIEVDRPNRQQRRRAGKSDTVDAVEAARAALSGRASGIAKTADGNAEAIRALLIAKRSARDTRIMCLNQIRHLGFTAPDDLRERLRGVSRRRLALVRATAPGLLALAGVGIDTAAILIVAAGDNPQRLHSEAAFAHLCGVAPIEASSGKTIRHRLNLGGNRQANHALWRIVFTRMSGDERTRKYVARRLAEGRSKPEIIRILKRYVARDVYKHLRRD